MIAIRRLVSRWPLFAAALLALSAAPPAKEKELADEMEPKPIDGVVVDAAGKPVGNITIDVYPGSSFSKKIETLKADAEGRFQVPGLWADHWGRQTLIINDGKRLGWCNAFQQTLRQKDGEKRLKITLLPLTKRVRGNLIDTDGKPLVGVGVHIWAILNFENPGIGTLPKGFLPGGKTNDKGEFTVMLPVGSGAYLWHDSPEYLRLRIHVKPDADDAGKIELPKGCQISGRVVDSAGKPVAGAKVGAQLQNPRGPGPAPHMIALAGFPGGDTGADGRYKLTGLSPGNYNVYFAPPENDMKLAAPAKEGVSVEPTKETTVNMTAVEGRLVTGQVLDVQSGNPLPKTYVGYYGVARPRSSATILGCKTDAEGKFQFYVPPGAAYIYISGGPRGDFTRLPESEVTFDVPEKGEIKPITLRISLKVPVRPNIQIRTIEPKRP